MTTKRALVSGRINKARGTMELSGQYRTVVGETDSKFNGSVLHHMARNLIASDGSIDEGYAYNHDGTLTAGQFSPARMALKK